MYYTHCASPLYHSIAWVMDGFSSIWSNQSKQNDDARSLKKIRRFTFQHRVCLFIKLVCSYTAIHACLYCCCYFFFFTVLRLMILSLFFLSFSLSFVFCSALLIKWNFCQFFPSFATRLGAIEIGDGGRLCSLAQCQMTENSRAKEDCKMTDCHQFSFVSLFLFSRTNNHETTQS